MAGKDISPRKESSTDKAPVRLGEIDSSDSSVESEPQQSGSSDGFVLQSFGTAQAEEEVLTEQKEAAKTEKEVLTARKETSIEKVPVRLGEFGSSENLLVSDTQAVYAQRRTFLEKAVTGVGVLLGLSVLYPITQFVVPPKQVKVSENEKIVASIDELPPNSAIIKAFAGDRVFILNFNGELKAMSAVCTHLGCLVQWKADESVVFCACHGARYTTTGEIISGPQPTPLKKYGVRVEDEQIVLSIV